MYWLHISTPKFQKFDPNENVEIQLTPNSQHTCANMFSMFAENLNLIEYWEPLKNYKFLKIFYKKFYKNVDFLLFSNIFMKNAKIPTFYDSIL